jgi:hypothetical protein
MGSAMGSAVDRHTYRSPHKSTDAAIFVEPQTRSPDSPGQPNTNKLLHDAPKRLSWLGEALPVARLFHYPPMVTKVGIYGSEARALLALTLLDVGYLALRIRASLFPRGVSTMGESAGLGEFPPQIPPEEITVTVRHVPEIYGLCCRGACKSSFRKVFKVGYLVSLITVICTQTVERMDGSFVFRSGDTS